MIIGLTGAAGSGKDSVSVANILVAELVQARRTAEYWKAEHFAGNALIDALRAEVEAIHAECDRLTALVAPDYCVSDTEVAGKIMRYLGFAVEPSLEPAVDQRRDRVAQLIRAAIDAGLPHRSEDEKR